MKKYIPFVCLAIVNSILIFLANLIYPNNFVLGSMFVSPLLAPLVAGFVWTAIVWVAKPIISKLGVKLQGRYLMFAFYWIANSVAIWITARLAPITGFGISAFLWAFILGFVANLLQYGCWKLGKFKALI